MRGVLSCLLAAFLMMIQTQIAEAQRGNPALQYGGATIDQLIADYMRENHVDGMALAIVQAPYISRACGYGVADVNKKLLVGTNTLFDLGQIKDAYTAVAVLQLVEQGKLKLADVQPLLLTPGRYLELEKLVASASGQSYPEFVRRHQLEPLGLRQTFFGSELPQVQTPGQFLKDHRFINPTEAAVSGPVNPDALYASAYDVSFWDIALAGDILIKSADLRKLIYRPGPTWTSGPWVYPGRPGLMVVTGNGHGFSSLLSRFTDPSDLVCVTLLANKEGLDLTQLARQIAGACDPRLGPPAQTVGMRVQQSPYSLEETVARLEKSLTANSITVLGRVDHSAAAKAVNLTLEPTYELIFGNPAAGTQLMQSNRAVAVDLPLRAVVYRQADGVWVAATDPVELARRHHITDREELIFKMRAGVDRVLLQAVSPTN